MSDETKPGAPVAPATGRAALYSALARAQSVCRKAELDGRFETGKVKYPFTSANERMAVARDALSQCGLALVRSGLPRLVQLARQREILDRESGEVSIESPELLLLEQDYLLTHESGEALATGFRWPVVPVEPYRPIDKAFAGADTSGLSYLIRDVLLIPSEESDDDKEGRSPGASTVKMPSRPAPPAASSPPPVAAHAPSRSDAQVMARPTAEQLAAPVQAPEAPSAPAPSAPAPLPASGLVIPPDVFDEAIAAGPAGELLALEAAGRAKLASAPLTAAKLYALQSDVQDRALYLEIFAVAERRFGSRERAIAQVKELGNPQGAVPTVGLLRRFVEVMP